MEQFQTFLAQKIINIAGVDITVAHILAVPTLLIVGYLIVGWVVIRTERSLKKRDVSPDVIQIVRRALTIIGLIVLVVTTLDFINVPLTAFAFVSGAVAIGVGFGAQNIINNFISGWILMWERPIRINDYIELGETKGTVEQINTRSTLMRRVDGIHLLVPNSKLLEEVVVNWTLVDNLLRCIVKVGVAYGSDVELVRKLLLQVASTHSGILKDPAPGVYFEDFGDSALNFELVFWVESGVDRGARMIRSDIRFEVDRVFKEHDVVIAFPQRDIHVNGSLQIQTGKGDH